MNVPVEAPPVGTLVTTSESNSVGVVLGYTHRGRAVVAWNVVAGLLRPGHFHVGEINADELDPPGGEWWEPWTAA